MAGRREGAKYEATKTRATVEAGRRPLADRFRKAVSGYPLGEASSDRHTPRGWPEEPRYPNRRREALSSNDLLTSGPQLGLSKQAIPVQDDRAVVANQN